MMRERLSRLNCIRIASRQWRYAVLLTGLVLTGLSASGSSLSVRVFDASSNEPISGVKVSGVNDHAQATNAGGKILIEELHAGNYQLHLSFPGYKSTIIQVSLLPDQESSVIVDMEKGSGTVVQKVPDSAARVVELQEVRVSLLTLDG